MAHIFIAVHPPEIRGVSYELSTAFNYGIIWIDRNYQFTNLPSFLVGANVFQVPHREIPLGTVIEILIYTPSIVYIAREKSRSGGFESSLPDDGWILVTDQGVVGSNLGFHYTNIWKKEVSSYGLTTLSLPATTTRELVHSIFVQGN